MKHNADGLSNGRAKAARPPVVPPARGGSWALTKGCWLHPEPKGQMERRSCYWSYSQMPCKTHPAARASCGAADPQPPLQQDLLTKTWQAQATGTRAVAFERRSKAASKQIQEQECQLIPLTPENKPWCRSDQHLPGDSHHSNSTVLMAWPH